MNIEDITEDVVREKLTLEGVEAWLKRQRENRIFYASDACKCLVAEYVKDTLTAAFLKVEVTGVHVWLYNVEIGDCLICAVRMPGVFLDLVKAFDEAFGIDSDYAIDRQNTDSHPRHVSTYAYATVAQIEPFFEQFLLSAVAGT